MCACLFCILWIEDIRLVVTGGGGKRDRELEEGSQNVQISSCMINEYQGYNGQHGDYSYHCWVIHRKVLKKVNLKNSHQREDLFFLFCFSYFYCIYMWKLILAETIVIMVSPYI